MYSQTRTTYSMLEQREMKNRENQMIYLAEEKCPQCNLVSQCSLEADGSQKLPGCKDASPTKERDVQWPLFLPTGWIKC